MAPLRSAGRYLLPALLLLGGVALAGFALAGDGRPAQAAVTWPTLTFTGVAGGFESPVHVTNAGDDRLFVVEQRGTIRVIDNGVVVPGFFLDIRNRIGDNFDNEEGLLSVAFPQDYQAGDWFWVFYTTPNSGGAGDNTLEVRRFRVTGSNPNDADENSFEPGVGLSIPHPNNTNHNGGQLAFGPGGYLYASTGDGGGGGCNSANPCPARPTSPTSLGRILRIDPADGDVDGQIAAGLRNPWRFSFDGGKLYIGDVGQGAFEEIDVVAVTASSNYDFGWNIKEGTHCYPPPNPCGPQAGLTDPVFQYQRAQGSFCAAVTGGHVYQGYYFFADYCDGRIWAYVDGEGAQVLPQSMQNITSFGLGADGSLYAATRPGGVTKITLNFPNPTNTPVTPATSTPTNTPVTPTSTPSTPATNAPVTPATNTPTGTLTPVTFTPTATRTNTPVMTPTGPAPTPADSVAIPGLRRE